MDRDTFDTLKWLVIIVATIIVISRYIAKKEQERKKKISTCPRCKTPFAYYSKLTDVETLSEGYVSEDVKDRDGIYRRQSFRAGKKKMYYTTTCEECGFTQSSEEIRSYKERI